MSRRAFSCSTRTSARVASLLLGACLAMEFGASVAEGGKQLYRWVDEHGEVHYTDQVPASASKHSRTTLTEEGVRTGTLPEAPTEEELQKAKAEEAKKAEEARKKAAKEESDKRLWMTYPTLDDLIMARNGRLAAVDASIQVKRDALRRDQGKLIAAKEPKPPARPGAAAKKAAEAEPVNVGELEARMRDGYAAIIDLEGRKDRIRTEFAGTIKRYKELKKLDDSKLDGESASVGEPLPNMVSCTAAEDCKLFWNRAVDYVRDHTEKGKEISGSGLFIGLQRDDREDRRFTVAWTQKSPAAPVNIFFDLQCKNRQTGSLACTDEGALAVRDGFRSAVLQGAEAGNP